MSKVYTLEQCKQHTTDKSCWVIIHGNVYDVTEFLEEHPGGFDIIVQSAGKDATQDFEDIGHSPQAKKLLEKYLLGTYEAGDSAPSATAQSTKPAAAAAAVAPSDFVSNIRGTFLAFLPVIVILLAVLFNKFYSK